MMYVFRAYWGWSYKGAMIRVQIGNIPHDGEKGNKTPDATDNAKCRLQRRKTFHHPHPNKGIGCNCLPDIINIEFSRLVVPGLRFTMVVKATAVSPMETKFPVDLINDGSVGREL